MRPRPCPQMHQNALPNGANRACPWAPSGKLPEPMHCLIGQHARPRGLFFAPFLQKETQADELMCTANAIAVASLRTWVRRQC